MSQIRGGCGHLLRVVQQKRRYCDEQKGEGEHFHIPPPYDDHLSCSGSAVAAEQLRCRVHVRQKRKGAAGACQLLSSA